MYGPPRAGPGSGQTPERRGRRRAGARRKHRVLRWSATTLSVLILGTAGAGYLYYQHLNGNIQKGERSSGDSKAQQGRGQRGRADAAEHPADRLGQP